MGATSLGAGPIQDLRGVYGDLPTFGDFVVAGGKLLIVVAVVWLTWWAVNRLTAAFEDHGEIVGRRNTAYLIVRAGMTIGTGFALVPLAGVLSDDTASDFLWLAVGGVVIGLVFALFIQSTLDLLLYGKLRSFNRLATLSTAHAIVIGAFYVADGLIVAGALSGSAPSLGIAIGATIFFALLGFATLAVAYLLIGSFYGTRQAVKDNNIAAAVLLGAIVVSFGLLLRKSVTGDWTGLGSGVVGFFVYAIVGVVVLVILIPALDKLFLGAESVRQVIKTDNYHAALAMAAITSVVALLISQINIV
jgi:hypothetical protein